MAQDQACGNLLIAKAVKLRAMDITIEWRLDLFFTDEHWI